MPEFKNPADRSPTTIGLQAGPLGAAGPEECYELRPRAASAGRRFRRELSAPGAARGFVAAVLEKWALDSAFIDDVRLVVTEIVANAVRHGKRGDVDLHVDLQGDALRVSVADRTPYETLPFAATPHWEEESGRGLLLIQLTADRWGHGPAAGDPAYGTEVWAEFKVPPDPCVGSQQDLPHTTAVRTSDHPMTQNTQNPSSLVPICGERTYLPAELLASTGEFAIPSSKAADVQQDLRCCLEEHDEGDHDHYAYVMDLDDPESGAVWTTWVRGELPAELLVLQDCPAVSSEELGREPCCEFRDHPGRHTWEIADPRSGGHGGRTTASR